MDNKNTAINQNVDLISTNGLDEMQREQAFKIASPNVIFLPPLTVLI